MPLFTRRFLPASILLIAFASAQTCYYPDGHTISTTDLPCDSTAAASACCPADAFCLSGGLCYAGGLVTRGSCSDRTWGSDACAGYCRTVNASGSVAITPCTDNEEGSNQFVCGAGASCRRSSTFTLSDDATIVLRPNQIAELVNTALATSVPSSSCADSSSTSEFPATVLAGVAIGVAAPLLIATGILYLMLRREQHRFSKPKLMYKLPDEVHTQDFTFEPPPPVFRTTTAFSSRQNSTSSRGTNVDTLASRRASMRTATTMESGRPPAAPTFIQHYEHMKKVAKEQLIAREHARDWTPMSPMSSRHELASPTQERHELSSSRMSNH